MTPAMVTTILEPVWLGFFVGLQRIAAFKEDLEGTGPDQLSTLAELLEAESYLRRRADLFSAAGLLTAQEVAPGKVVLWPNAAPVDAVRDQVIAAYLDKNPALREAIDRRKQADTLRLEAAMQRLADRRAGGRAS